MSDKEDYERKFESYKLAIQARNYHSDIALKWMIFYSTLVGAIFIGYYTVKCEVIERFLIALLGVVVSLCWYLSAKGYYYWVVHWMMVVLKFEKELKLEETNNEVYALFYRLRTCWLNPTSGYNISTFKVTLFFISSVLLSWIYLFLKEINFTSISLHLDIFSKIHLLEFIFLGMEAVLFIYLICHIESDASKHTHFKGNYQKDFERKKETWY